MRNRINPQNATSCRDQEQLKKIVFKGGWYFFASIFVKVLQVLIFPIVTRYIDTKSYGVLETVNSIRQIMPIILSLCLDAAYYRFYYKYNGDETKLKLFISTYFWVVVLWGITVTVVSIIVSYVYLQSTSNLFLFHPFMTLTMIGSLLYQLSFIGNAYQQQNLKAEFVGIVSTAYQVLLHVVFIFLLLVPQIGAESKIYGIFAADVIYSIVYIGLLCKKRLIAFQWDFSIVLEGLLYSLPLIPSQLCVWITQLSDKIVLGAYKGFSETGIYSVGYALAQLVAMFSGAVFLAYKPMIFTMLTEDEGAGGKKISNFLPIYYFVSLWLGIGISLLSREAITILTHKSYYDAFVFVPIISLSCLFQALYRPFNEILNYYRKTVMVALGAILQALANLILNILFIPKFGAMAAAWSTLVSFLLLCCWVILWAQKEKPIQIKWKKLFFITFLGIFCYLVISYFDEAIRSLGLFCSIALKVAVIALFVVSTFFVRILKVSDLKL